jgi:transposase
VLLRELRALGYAGGVSILKDHLATPKPVARPEPLIRFETEPGRQMQANFATIRRGKDRLAVFIATLDWSQATRRHFDRRPVHIGIAFAQTYKFLSQG